MDLVFLQHPPIVLCWILSLTALFLIPVFKRYSGLVVIVSAAAGAGTLFLGLFYGIPTKELLLIVLVNAVFACGMAWKGGGV